MRVSLRTEGNPTAEHGTVRVFVNGASAGLLTMRVDELAEFRELCAGSSETTTPAPRQMTNADELERFYWWLRGDHAHSDTKPIDVQWRVLNLLRDVERRLHNLENPGAPAIGSHQ